MPEPGPDHRHQRQVQQQTRDIRAQAHQRRYRQQQDQLDLQHDHVPADPPQNDRRAMHRSGGQPFQGAGADLGDHPEPDEQRTEQGHHHHHARGELLQGLGPALPRNRPGHQREKKSR